MFNFLLTQNSTPIIGWCANLLGRVMQVLYLLFDKGLDIRNIGLCIIIFTLIVKLLMIPLTIKQQKFSKLSALMNPELQAIQKKYQGKRDNESMMKMQEETKAIYSKYGTSPTGSCLQLLITMPIMFALYYVISNVPAYVPQVYDYYEPVAKSVEADYQSFDYINQAFDNYVLKNDNKNDKDSKNDNKNDNKISQEIRDIDKDLDSVVDSFHTISTNKVVDVLAKYKNSQWNSLINTYGNIDKIVDQISVEDWNKLLESEKDKGKKDDLQKFVDQITGDQKDQFIKELKTYNSNDNEEYKGDDIEQAVKVKAEKKEIMHINEFGPINLSQSPKDMMGIALLVPFLSFLTQWLSAKLAMSANKDQMQDNPMGNSMKVMNIVLPLFSAFIAYTVPAGVGLYWVCLGLFQIITQVIINAYFKKVDMQDIINKNVEKMQKKKEKMGIDTSKVSNAASTNTKSIKNKSISSKANVDVKKVEEPNVKFKKGSISEKANMVKNFNDKNRK